MPESATTAPTTADPAAVIQSLRTQLSRALLGKREAVDLILTALLARGHVLIEDLPGLGKTTLARALAKAVGGGFSRVQFTPDLLPSDILGTSIYHQATGEFTWRPGPIFANFVLADEINRATPRTQAALLEAMSEGRVSADGITRPLPQPFMVMATQNPAEHAGTYPLPESQLDRFAVRMKLGYPDRSSERQMLSQFAALDATEAVEQVATPADLLSAQRRASEVRVSDAVADYILAIVGETRRHPKLVAGASPRASLMLYRCSQARALVEGREFVTPDDVKALGQAVLGHRVMEKAALERGRFGLNGSMHSESVVQRIIERVEVPV